MARANTLAVDRTAESSEESLSEQVYLEISQRIIDGKYRPGSRLREREIAEELNVSRVPVREALPRLESNGFIFTYPRRGAIIKQMTLRDVEELFDLRLCLEVFAARRAAEVAANGAPSPLLQQVMNQAMSIVDGPNEREISNTNAEFHTRIVEMTGNELLRMHMKSLAGRLRWLFTHTPDQDPRIQCAEHLALCKAIYDGRPDLAAALAFSHIEMGRKPSLEALKGVLPPK